MDLMGLKKKLASCPARVAMCCVLAGGMSAKGLILPRVFLDRQAGLSITGAVGSVYIVQCSTNPAWPASWRPFTVVTLLSNKVSVPYTLPGASDTCFYRALLRTNAPTNMVLINAGSFVMGSPVTETDRFGDEGPQTVVTITRAFYLAARPVTQGEYRSVTGVNPSSFTGDTNLPVEHVSWSDATNYCALLTKRELNAGRIQPGWQYRLPTEAEWEYACRAGTTARFSFGDDP